MPSSTTTAPTGQVPAGEEPQDGSGSQPQDGAPDGDGEQPTEPVDVAVLQRELAKAREQAAKSRIDLKAAQKAEQDRTNATLTEQQRLEQRTKELEQEIEELREKARRANLAAVITQKAQRLGIIDPEAAVILLAAEKDLEFDDEGNPTNADERLRELLKTRPYLALKGQGAPPPAGINSGDGTQGGPTPKLSPAELEAARAAGIPPERYEALKGVRTLADWQATRK